MVSLEQDRSQLDVVIETLKYDLSSKTKTYDQNVQSMKHRISELELQLQQARSEAEIYYKNVVERNLDATQVSNKVSFKVIYAAFVTCFDVVLKISEKLFYEGTVIST